MKQSIIAGLLVAAVILPSFSSAEYVYYTTGNTSASNNTPASSLTPVGTTACLNLSGNLRYQDSDIATNGAVTLLQNFLYTKGYLKVVATGYFGPLTRDAVTAFQTQYGLVANPPAFVGPQTRAKIQSVSCVSSSGTTQTQTASPTSCLPGDIFDIRTGLRCTFTQTGTNTVTTTNSTTTTQTASATTNPLSPPTILPTMHFTAVTPVTNVASTTRLVAIRWLADSTVSVIGIALMNDTTSTMIDLSTSTPNDGSELILLSSATIPDASYSMVIYWPLNKLSGSTSPVGTVTVSNKLISIKLYPATTTTSGQNITEDYAAIASEYAAQIAESQKDVEEKKDEVKKAKTAAEKESALQKLCAGYKFFLDPADCSFIKLTGI